MYRALFPLALLACGAPGIPKTGATLIAEASGSNFSEDPNEVRVVRSAAVAFRTQVHHGAWRFGPSIELNGWLTRDLNNEDDPHAALQLGIDGAYLFVDGYVKTQVSAGASVLLDGTENDLQGAVGPYVDVRPATYRLLLTDGLVLGIAPISTTLLLPDPKGIPLVEIQFRAVVSVEFDQ